MIIRGSAGFRHPARHPRYSFTESETFCTAFDCAPKANGAHTHTQKHTRCGQTLRASLPHVIILENRGVTAEVSIGVDNDDTKQREMLGNRGIWFLCSNYLVPCKGVVRHVRSMVQLVLLIAPSVCFFFIIRRLSIILLIARLRLASKRLPSMFFFTRCIHIGVGGARSIPRCL